jgi:hypothetical protein
LPNKTIYIIVLLASFGNQPSPIASGRAAATWKAGRRSPACEPAAVKTAEMGKTAVSDLFDLFRDRYFSADRGRKLARRSHPRGQNKAHRCIRFLHSRR